MDTEYLEWFYNLRRRHPTLGNVSPADYERAMAEGAAAQSPCLRSRVQLRRRSQRRRSCMAGKKFGRPIMVASRQTHRRRYGDGRKYSDKTTRPDAYSDESTRS